MEDVVAAIVNIPIVDQCMIEDGSAAVVVAQDSSGKEYLVLLTTAGSARTQVWVDTDEVLARSDEPSSVAAGWAALTGRETYGQ